MPPKTTPKMPVLAHREGVTLALEGALTPPPELSHKNFSPLHPRATPMLQVFAPPPPSCNRIDASEHYSELFTLQI